MVAEEKKNGGPLRRFPRGRWIPSLLNYCQGRIYPAARFFRSGKLAKAFSKDFGFPRKAIVRKLLVLAAIAPSPDPLTNFRLGLAPNPNRSVEQLNGFPSKHAVASTLPFVAEHSASQRYLSRSSLKNCNIRTVGSRDRRLDRARISWRHRAHISSDLFYRGGYQICLVRLRLCQSRRGMPPRRIPKPEPVSPREPSCNHLHCATMVVRQRVCATAFAPPRSGYSGRCPVRPFTPPCPGELHIQSRRQPRPELSWPWPSATE